MPKLFTPNSGDLNRMVGDAMTRFHEARDRAATQVQATVRFPSFNLEDLKFAGSHGVFVRHLGQDHELVLRGKLTDLMDYLEAVDMFLDAGAFGIAYQITEVK